MNKGKRKHIIDNSFIYNGNGAPKKQFLSLLRKRLVKAGYLMTKTRNFYQLFNNAEIKNSVVWCGTISELRYFILLLLKKDIIKKPNHIWKVVQKCFEVKDMHFDSKSIGKHHIPSKDKIERIELLFKKGKKHSEVKKII